MRSQQLRGAGFLALAGFMQGDAHAEQTGVTVATEFLADLSVPPAHCFLYGADAVLALAERHARRGRLDDAHDLISPHRETAERTGWLEHAGRAHHALGVLHAHRGQTERAETEFRMAVARSTGRWSDIEWRSRAALGRLGDVNERRMAEVMLEDLSAALPTSEAAALRRLG